MPADEGVRVHDDQRGTPVVPYVGQLSKTVGLVDAGEAAGPSA